jgi:hypothetical protein
MTVSADQLSAAIAAEANRELTDALQRIEHCLDQLTDGQVWLRPREGMNSLGNLILHLSGNVRQWIISGLGGAPDVRNRPAEFAERGPIPKAELLATLRATVVQAQAAIAQASPEAWLRIRRIQGFEVTGLGAVFHSLPHFRGHTQEIVHMTRELLGAAYRFAWVPQTKEQGAAD